MLCNLCVFTSRKSNKTSNVVLYLLPPKLLPVFFKKQWLASDRPTANRPAACRAIHVAALRQTLRTFDLVNCQVNSTQAPPHHSKPKTGSSHGLWAPRDRPEPEPEPKPNPPSGSVSQRFVCAAKRSLRSRPLPFVSQFRFREVRNFKSQEKLPFLISASASFSCIYRLREPPP